MSDPSAPVSDDPLVSPAVRAAVEVARGSGIECDAPALLQETNNTVVWLRPHQVIAKVGTHRDSGQILTHEHRVASALAELGAPIAPPLRDTGVEFHAETGFVVTLWTRLEVVDRRSSPTAIGHSLQQLHRALAIASLELPPLDIHIQRARRALFDDEVMEALPEGDRTYLRTAFDDLADRYACRRFDERSLHGEPHLANLLDTSGGIRWIDFEDACRGPLEWDIVFLPEESLAVFPDIDRDLLDLLRTLSAAIFGTWGWVQARFPEMRAFGQERLEVVRARWRPRGD